MKGTLKDLKGLTDIDVKGKATETRGLLERLAQDEELRQTVGHAVKAGKGIYRELKGAGSAGAAEKLARDKKVRKHLGALIDDSKDAHQRLRGKRSHKLRNLLLLGSLLGAVYACKDQLKDLLDGGSNGGTGGPGGAGHSAHSGPSRNGSGS